jgi:hypothetical protein
MSPEECKKLRDGIYDKNDKLQREFEKYDPVSDAQGGSPMRWGSGFTKPFGHYDEIRDLQRGIKRDLERYNRYCCNNDDGNPPVTRNVDELANQPVYRLPGPIGDMPFIMIPPEGGPAPVRGPFAPLRPVWVP